MQSSTYNRIQQGLRFARNYTLTLLGAALFWNSLAALATDQLLTLRLPKVESIKVGEGVSWLLRSTPRNGKQPAVFLVSGPAGVSFRRVSEDQHQLNWSPSPDDLGRHRFTFLLEDVADRSISVTQTLQVDVLPVAKESVVTLGPVQDQSVRPGEHLRFRVAAENSLGGGTLLHIDKLPEGARFDQSDDGSRTFTWQPGEHQSGHYVFRIIATDANDSALFDEATIKVTVGQPLAASELHGKATPDPEQGVDIGSVGNTVDLVTATSIESLPERVIVAGQAMSQLVRAEYSADEMELVAARLPEGASFEIAAGRERVFRWRPGLNQPGLHQATFILRDRQSLKTIARQDLHLSVRLDRVTGENKPPLLHVSGPEEVKVGEQLNLEIAAVDPDGHTPLLMVGAAPPSARFIDTGNGQRRFVWSPGKKDQGVHLLEFIARDRQAPEREVLQRIRVVVNPAEALP